MEKTYQNSEILTTDSLRELYGGRRFNSYSMHFKRLFGARMQKVTINAGFTCPNRDGRLGEGGCTFCNNNAFTPSYCFRPLGVTQQIDEGIEFHSRRYRSAGQYLAYFQSFSNTYAPLDELRKIYDEALSHPQIAGVIVGTRPDCVDEQVLDYFAELARDKYVTLEYGIESTYDATLERINRGHNFEQARWAVEQTAQRGVHVGAHFILGLPGESEQMLHDQMEVINSLPLSTIKFHQLQIFKQTAMADEYDEHPERFSFWSVEEYIDMFIGLLRKLRPEIVMERFASEAPPRYHHGPNWGMLRNESILSLFEKRLAELDAYQGDFFIPLQQ